jgi:dynein heavy chain 1
MALKGALRSYTVARELITPELEPLVMPQLRSIRESVAEAFGVSSDGTNRVSSSRRVRWDGKEIAEWVAGLTELVSRFEERVETLLHACESVDTQLNLLSQMEYDREQFLIAVQNIQKTVDELSLAGYSDLRTWVTIVDEKMGLVLSRRLENAILAWTKTFNFMNEENSNNFDEEEKKLDEISNHTPTIHSSKIVVEILLRNQEISTSPSLPVVRSIFLQKFHDYISVVCSLPRPSSGRFEVFESGGGSPKTVGTFDRLVHEISTEKIANAYTCIEFYMEKVSKLVQQWFAYQDLWDTRVSDVANAVGDNMESWRTLLDEASEARNTLDSTSTSSDFGPVLVKYDKVHSQVNLKYDSWQKELQSCYADLLGQKIIDFHEKVCNAKSKLEGVTLDGATATYDLVLNVTFIQEMKDNLEPWSNSVSILLDAERLLKRQRHIFRSDWMEGSRLQGQYEHMEHILSKRSRSMEEQMPLLQTRIIAEDKVAEHRTLELLASWDIEKPLRGNMSPDQAKELLSKYEFNVKKAKIDDENLIKAKDALGLDAKLRNGSITSCLDEMSDLKEVWDAVSNPFESLAKIKQIFWVSATPRKIRKQLEDITTGKIISLYPSPWFRLQYHTN